MIAWSVVILDFYHAVTHQFGSSDKTDKWLDRKLDTDMTVPNLMRISTVTADWIVKINIISLIDSHQMRINIVYLCNVVWPSMVSSVHDNVAQYRPTSVNAGQGKGKKQPYMQNITNTVVTWQQIYSSFFLGVLPRNITRDFRFPMQSYFMINLFIETHNDVSDYWKGYLFKYIPHINTTYSSIWYCDY